MDEKLTIQDLIELLAAKHGMTKKNAEVFVKEFFSLIEDALETDRTVKIKGLGSFRLVDVEDRESINVTTGERYQIKGHTKVSFTPDTTLRDIINKPFAHFETVVLNENTVLEDTPIEEEEEEHVDNEPMVAEEEPVAVIEDEPTVAEKEQPIVVEEEPTVTEEEQPVAVEEEPAVTEEEQPTAIENEPVVAEEEQQSVAVEEDEQPAAVEDEPTVVAAEEEQQPAVVEEEPTVTEEEQPVAVEEDEQPAVEDELTVAEEEEEEEEETETVEEGQPVFEEPVSVRAEAYKRHSSKRRSRERSPIPYLLIAIIATVLVCGGVVFYMYFPELFSSSYYEFEIVEPKHMPKDKQPVQQKVQRTDTTIVKKNTSSNGYSDTILYKIVGTKARYTMKEGESLIKVSMRFYGTRGLWSYIVQHNPTIIKNPDNVPCGTTIEIPELAEK